MEINEIGSLKDYKQWLAMKNKKRNKYTGMTKEDKYVSCTCTLGHMHNSRDEKSYCNVLKYRKDAGDIKSFKVEVYYPFVINGHKICGHYVDFQVVNNDGTIHVEEYKGFETALWRIKKKLFKACYPDIEYKVIRKGDVNFNCIA